MLEERDMVNYDFDPLFKHKIRDYILPIIEKIEKKYNLFHGLNDSVVVKELKKEINAR